MIEEDIRHGGNITNINKLIISCTQQSFTKVLDWLLKIQEIMLQNSSTVYILPDELKEYNHCYSIKKVLKDHNLL